MYFVLFQSFYFRRASHKHMRVSAPRSDSLSAVSVNDSIQLVSVLHNHAYVNEAMVTENEQVKPRRIMKHSCRRNSQILNFDESLVY